MSKRVRHRPLMIIFSSIEEQKIYSILFFFPHFICCGSRFIQFICVKHQSKCQRKRTQHSHTVTKVIRCTCWSSENETEPKKGQNKYHTTITLSFVPFSFLIRWCWFWRFFSIQLMSPFNLKLGLVYVSPLSYAALSLTMTMWDKWKNLWKWHTYVYI